MIKHLIKLFFFKSILTTIPNAKTVSNKKNIGICVVLPHKHVDIFIFTIHIFFFYIKTNLPIYIVDDMSSDSRLTTSDIKKLKKHFSVIIDSKTSPKMSFILKKYPFFKKYRFGKNVPPSKLKFDALFLNPFSKFILIDPDVLFFSPPIKIINFIQNKTKKIMYISREKNAQNKYPFLRESELFLRLMLRMYQKSNIQNYDPFFTLGLLAVPDKKYLNLRQFNLTFKLFTKVNCSKDWLSEERACSLSISSKYLMKLPPKTYFTLTQWSQYIHINFDNVVAVHYQGITGLKKRLITDSIILFFKLKFFKNKYN
jgi:hypothetical protein